MPGVIGRRARRTSKKTSNKEANKPQPRTPITISSIAKAGSVATLVFNQPVSLKGTPAMTTNLPGITATSAALTAPNTVTVTFSGAIATATTLNVPFEDPAIRNASGGFVTPASMAA